MFTGQLGGAIADLAGLIGEVVSVERVPITFTVDGGEGRLVVGDVADADLIPFTGATGKTDRALRDRLLDDPGLPGLRREVRPLHPRAASSTGCRTSTVQGNNALQGHFRFAA